MLEPKLPLTVPLALWEAIARDVRPTFADSYLSGALTNGSSITPHTTAAHAQLARNPWAMKAIADLGFRLIEPLPFGHPDRPDSFAPHRIAAE